MERPITEIQDFFAKQSFWLHVTSVLILSYVFMKLSQPNLADAYMYAGWVGGFLLFSIPILVLVLVRDNHSFKHARVYWCSWGIAFFIYPTILFFAKLDLNSLGFTQYLFHNDITGQYAFQSLVTIYTVLEAVIFLGKMRKLNRRDQTWHTKFSVFHLTLIVAALFSFFLLVSNNYIQDYLDGKSLFAYPLRLLACYFLLVLTYLSYYIYYYLHHHLLYNGIFKERGLVPYLLGLALTILVVAPVQNYLIKSLPFISELKLHSTGLAPSVYDELNFGLPILVLLASFPLIVISEWYKQAHTVQELEQQQTKTELSLLRQQINPHFFFNTLNNLYAMSLAQAEETPETILKLSDLMRYVIYQGKEDQVELHQEVCYLQDYLDLQLIRIRHQVDWKFDLDIDNEQVKLPPLLFIILVENAFKHGIEAVGTASMLHLSLKEGNGQITFACVNSKPHDSQMGSSGIGLSNLRKRLQLLFPNRHELTLVETDTRFHATLSLTL